MFPDMSFSDLLAQRGIKATDIARQLGLNKSSITLWSLRRVPLRRIPELEKLTGIPRHELRPDIYPPPEQSAAVA